MWERHRASRRRFGRVFRPARRAGRRTVNDRRPSRRDRHLSVRQHCGAPTPHRLPGRRAAVCRSTGSTAAIEWPTTTTSSAESPTTSPIAASATRAHCSAPAESPSTGRSGATVRWRCRCNSSSTACQHDALCIPPCSSANTVTALTAVRLRVRRIGAPSPTLFRPRPLSPVRSYRSRRSRTANFHGDENINSLMREWLYHSPTRQSTDENRPGG